jgi:hypothetical protein
MVVGDPCQWTYLWNLKKNNLDGKGKVDMDYGIDYALLDPIPLCSNSHFPNLK